MGDIVVIMYEKKVTKGDYKIARVMSTRKDCHGRVRTVTVGFRGKDKSSTTLPYIPKPLNELTLGVQRLAVICPIEEQTGNSGGEVDSVGGD